MEVTAYIEIGPEGDYTITDQPFGDTPHEQKVWEMMERAGCKRYVVAIELGEKDAA